MMVDSNHTGSSMTLHSDHDPESVDKVTEPDNDPESLDKVTELLQTTKKHAPPDKASELSQRKVSSPMRLSKLSMKYDLDNNGVLDEHEKELRAMDQGDGLEPGAVYRKLLELTTVATKLSSTKRLLMILFIFAIFIVFSNLAMAFVAVNLSKDVEVNGSGALTATDGGGVISTKAVGTSYRTKQEEIDASLSVPTAGRRLNQNSEGDTCKLVDFDPAFDNADYLKGTLSKAHCIDAYRDADRGASVSLTIGNSETHIISKATTLYDIALDGCQSVKIIVGEGKTWYFQSCDETADTCEWFETTENDDFDVPCCLRTFPTKIELGAKCVCSKQCESNHECVPLDDGLSSVCIEKDNVSTESPFSLSEDYFNHVGRLQEVSEELFDTVWTAMDVVLAMQNHSINNGVTYEMKRKEGLPNADVRFNATDGNDSNGGNYGMDALDEVAVEKVGDICFGVWRGTALSLEDWGQNLNMFRTTLFDDCKVRRGFSNAFYERDLWFTLENREAKMEQKLRDCASECVPSLGQKCTVVLTGYSQGAALATVGAALLHDLHPVVITSAGPPAFFPVNGKLCSVINQDRVFRFIGTKTSDRGKLKYDPVPHSTGGATHVGHEFRVSEKSTSSLAYYYLNYPKVYIDKYSGFGVHSFSNYIIPELYTPINDAREFPLRLGFDNELSCSRDDECGSGRCERVGLIPPFGATRLCKPLAVDDDFCNENTDCASGRCESNFPRKATCKSTLEKGKRCNEDSDCQSLNCIKRTWRSDICE